MVHPIAQMLQLFELLKLWSTVLKRVAAAGIRIANTNQAIRSKKNKQLRSFLKTEYLLIFAT